MHGAAVSDGLPAAAETMASRQLKRLAGSGLPHLVLSTLSVQGLAYVAQFSIATILAPSDFGVVRSVESMLALLVLAGSLGMPTLTLRLAADTHDPEVRGRLLGRCLQLAAGSSLLLGAALAVGAVLWARAIGTYLSALVLVATASSASRVCVAYHQGIGRIRDVSLLTFRLAFLCIPLAVAPVIAMGLTGWVVGRYLSEGLLLAALLYRLRSVIRFLGPLPSSLSLPQLASAGATVSFSLLLRYSQDAVGLLVLSRAAPGSPGLGHLGLGLLMVSALMVIPGAVGTVFLPRMVQARHSRDASRKALRSQILLALGSAVLPCAVMASSASVWVAVLLPKYRGAEGLLAVLLCVAPCRALTAAAGNLLLAHARYGFAVVANAFALASLAALSLALVGRLGALGVAWATLLVEAVCATAFAAAAWHTARRAGEISPGGSVAP
jgi:O-antigen/teichoic acid export membrane protein